MYSNLTFFNYDNCETSITDQFVFYSKITKSYNELFQNRKYISRLTNEVVKTNSYITNSSNDYNFIYLCTSKIILNKLNFNNKQMNISVKVPVLIDFISKQIFSKELGNNYKILYSYLNNCNIISVYLYNNTRMEYNFIHRIGEIINPSVIYID